MTAPAGPPLADTQDMRGLHQVFRNAFGGHVDLIADAATSDAERVTMVATYFDNVLRLLHGHHEGEDELMTPLLMQRASPDEIVEVEAIAAQHASVMSAIAAAEEAIEQWRGSPSDSSAMAAVAALRALNAGLTPHLDAEEEVVLPIAGKYITAPEWGQLPAHGTATFTGDKIWLILGLIRNQMTIEQLAHMDAHLPPPAAEFWVNQGQALYDGFALQLGI